MNLKVKESLSIMANCAMYKFISILAYIEFIGVLGILGYVYSIENPALRPMGTLLIAFGISFLIAVVNVLFAIVLLLECKFRKNMKDTRRTKITNIGAILYLIILVVSFFWFVINWFFSFSSLV